MNMNLGIVNRALLATGQNALTDGDIKAENSAFILCKEFYIATFLEALSEAEWVGGRKRDKLVRTGRPVIPDQKYLFAYDMPFDCAKPIELQKNEFFLTEDRLILTDMPDAELLYVSNGKVLRPIAAASAPRPGELPDMEYLSAGPPDTEHDVTLYPGLPGEIKTALPQDPPPAEDYPDYRAPDYEPKFYEYCEKRLAAKFAMKLSNRPELHTQLLQEALLIKQEAVDASRSSRAAKNRESPWWTEKLSGKGDKNADNQFLRR